jgi:hypothetical protein
MENALPLHVVAEHELGGIRVQVRLIHHPGNWIPPKMMQKQSDRHNQG